MEEDIFYDTTESPSDSEMVPHTTDKTRFAKVYRILVDVLRPCIATFVDRRIKSGSLDDRLKTSLSNVKSIEDLDIPALSVIATKILKPHETKQGSDAFDMPENLISSVKDLWDQILYMQFQENAFFDENIYQNYIKQFHKLAENFEQLNNQHRRYVEDITSIVSRNMDNTEVGITLIGYHDSCSELLNTQTCVERAYSKKEDTSKEDGKIWFVKSFLILMDVIKPALCTYLDQQFKRKGTSVKEIIKSHDHLSAQKRFSDEILSKVNSALDLDFTALYDIVYVSKIVTIKTEKELIKGTVAIRNNLFHSPYPNLTNDEYRDSLKEYKQIAYAFEKLNRESGKYVSEVDRVDREMLNEKEVRVVIDRYQSYCIEVVTYMIVGKGMDFEELRKKKEEIEKPIESDCYTQEYAARLSREARSPVGKATLGFFGGLYGLSQDADVWLKKNLKRSEPRVVQKDTDENTTVFPEKQ